MPATLLEIWRTDSLDLPADTERRKTDPFRHQPWKRRCPPPMAPKVNGMTSKPTWEDLKNLVRFRVDPEADQGNRAAFRLLNKRQDGRLVIEWSTQFLEVVLKINVPFFHVQLSIETVDEYRQHLACMENPPRTVDDIKAEATRPQSILKREIKAAKKTDFQEIRRQVEGNAYAPGSKKRRIDGIQELSSKDRSKERSHRIRSP
ncbi:uncharacterized protein BDW70DRAFT_162137 [Aspergillus foveolatus]|uniref:uncharacterized protein n=1 Tax=Aspergillus foveolatus TaxID=210207 RepID=UPI003CCD9F50